MKEFLKSHHRGFKVTAFIAVVMTLLLLTLPALAAEMTPEQKLAQAAQLSAQASEMAATARETGNVELLQQAMALAAEAANLIAQVVAYAADTGNAELAQAAMNGATNLSAAINLIIATAQYFVQTGTTPSIVNAANGILTNAGSIQNLNNNSMSMAVAAGASPGPPAGYGPPAGRGLGLRVRSGPPITDHGPASPI